MFVSRSLISSLYLKELDQFEYTTLGAFSANERKINFAGIYFENLFISVKADIHKLF